MAVDEARARAAGHAVERGGKTFYFCSDGCHAAFQASPDKYAAAAHGDHAGALHAQAETRP
jgi:Cu+-exporting ATPase